MKELHNYIANVQTALDELNAYLSTQNLPKIATKAQKRRKYTNTQIDAIYDAIEHLPQGVKELSTQTLLTYMPKGVSMHVVGRCMRDMGWESTTKRLLDGTPNRVWRNGHVIVKRT